MPVNAIFAELLGDAEIEALFSEDAMFADFLAFQSALVAAQGRDAGALADFAPDLEAVARGTLADGVPIPAWLAALKAHAPGLADVLHKNATSQDLTDTALTLALQRANAIFAVRLKALAGTLETAIDRDGARPLDGRTRMQRALPITVGDRLGGWLEAVRDLEVRLRSLRPDVEVLQYGGPVGLNPVDDLAKDLAARLGLGAVRPWHTNRIRLASYGAFLSLVTGALGKIGQDIGLMAQMGEVTLSGGTSSSMPGKNNPVRAEVLVALARKTAADLSALHGALIAEQERSGAAMTLEWLVLPGMVAQTGAALNHASALIASVSRFGAP